MGSLINPSHDGNYNSHSSSPHSHRPSVLVIILILLMTPLISVSIFFLLRYLKRCRHRSIPPPSSSFSSTAVTSDSRRFSGHRVAPERERSSVLDPLPTVKFSVTRRSTSTITGDCAVCLSQFEPEEQLRLFPLCSHAFHADCIDVWLVSNQTCPLCRSLLFPNRFRLEIGSISRRQIPIPESSDQHRSYPIVESEISESNFNRRSTPGKHEDAVEVTSNPSSYEASLAADVGNEGAKSWLKDYLDTLSSGISSRAMSLRSSGSFFTGSSRRTEEFNVVDLEANHAGESFRSAGSFSTGSSRRTEEILVVDLETNHLGEEISEFFRWLSDW